MSDSSSLAGLKDCAETVFSLASRLGEELAGNPSVAEQSPNHVKSRLHSATFQQLADSISKLREAINCPPAGFEAVAKLLAAALPIVDRVRDELDRDPGSAEMGKLRAKLTEVGHAGAIAIRAQPDTPESFLSSAAGDQPRSAFAFSQLERFPLTPEGNVAFLEWVRLEVREQGRYLRKAKYETDCIDRQLKHGVKWQEARARCSLLAESDIFSVDLVEEAVRVLKYDLSAGTVEQVADLLTLAVRGLRDAFERARKADTGKRPIVVEATGKLLSARHEPKRRGRRGADPKTVEKEAALAAKWEAARIAGGYKPQFAKNVGIKLSQLEALLDRVAKRKRASE